LRAKAREEGATEREVLNASAIWDWSKLSESCTAMSLFGDKKIVELRLASPRPGVKGTQALTDIASMPLDGVTLVVTIPYDWSLKKAAWYKALTANAEVVECNSVSARELPSWFAARLAKKNLKAEPAALKILSDRCEGNLLAAAQEVLKLAYLFPEGSVITQEAVTDSVRDVARFDVENLLEAMFAGDAAKSLRIVENLNAAGESIPSFMWMITEELRMTLKFRAAIDNGSDRNSALRQAGIWGDRSSRITRAAGRLNTRKLSSALLLCADIDKISKGLTVPNRDTDPWIEIAALAAFVAS
jgi:DNA polymerase-3 subunit delta